MSRLTSATSRLETIHCLTMTGLVELSSLTQHYVATEGHKIKAFVCAAGVL